MSDTKNVAVHFPYAGLLGVAFVVLKLTGHVTWSWWWVTLPFWAPFAVLFLFLLFLLVIALIAGAANL